MTRKPKYPTAAQWQERAEWASRFYRCWICGTMRAGVEYDIHEIASRGQAPGKWADLRSYFFTCRICHDEVLSWLPEDVQCAFKYMKDNKNYDRDFINRARGRAPNAIAEHEVRNWSRFLERIGV